MRQLRTAVAGRRREISLIRLLAGRRGYSLIAVMINISILSVLLGTCGMCLQTMFRLDHRQRVNSQLLDSLRRMERQLREDAVGGVFSVAGGAWRIEARAGSEVRVWSVSRGVVQREVTVSGVVESRERYVFPAGTRVEFSDLQADGAVVRIQEGSRIVRYPEAGDGGAVRNKPESVSLPAAPEGGAEAGEIAIHLRGAVFAEGDPQ